MPRLDVPDGAALRAHHHGVRLRPTLEETHAAQEIAGSDAGGGEDDVPARHLVDLEHLLHVLDPHLLRALDLLLVARSEPALHVATHAADGGGGDHARSEEHTSELQSQSNLVCRLLLETKKST